MSIGSSATAIMTVELQMHCTFKCNWNSVVYVFMNFEKFEKWIQWVFGLKLGNGTPFENFEKWPLDQWNIINSINTHYQIK